MPRACPVCMSEQRPEIDKALLSGSATCGNIANSFGLPYWAVYRHKQRHLPAALVKALEVQEVARAGSLLSQLTELKEKALALLDKAEEGGDLRTALAGVREARGCLELFLKAFEAANLESRVRALEDKVLGGKG